ncbi:hypothetical protein BHU72_01205 [Desulfuribacillus stibiiarsenatis]|uniref:Calcineurin-like phosphoesterase domain-containing protein n=1 Tax=Desulfuribacillus stibiiarsenatis TaxID=1390249 RepID=A0A1E5LA09_9FIRM|nr:metallophosphoesterase [Desulfuribacillus stibiiarsenatis]OEH86908.1 hypothetical protein BHU72_01205 [Desulfuribacillus stibiiarsenatis]
MILLSILILGFLGMCYTYWNTFRPILREVQVDLSRGKYDIDGLRVLHLSDMHMERISVTPEKMFEHIATTKPDMIVLTGDYLDQAENLPKWKLYMEQLANLKPRYGMFAVLGNHDYRIQDKVQELIEIMESFDCKVLFNESVQIQHNQQTINIIGIDDYHTRRSNIQQSFKNVKEGATIVITHDPNIILHMDKEYRIDYLMAGHLHGGQFNIPYAFMIYPMGALPRNKMYKGLLDYKGTRLYISEGLGQSALNVRFNSRPEITLHKL